MNRDEARMILLKYITQVDSSEVKHYTEGIERILTELGFLDKQDCGTQTILGNTPTEFTPTDIRIDTFTTPIPEPSINVEGIHKAGIDIHFADKSVRVTEIIVRITPETGIGCIVLKTDEFPGSFTIGIKKDLDKPDVVHSLPCPKCNSVSNLHFAGKDCVGCDNCCKCVNICQAKPHSTE